MDTSWVISVIPRLEKLYHGKGFFSKDASAAEEYPQMNKIINNNRSEDNNIKAA